MYLVVLRVPNRPHVFANASVWDTHQQAFLEQTVRFCQMTPSEHGAGYQWEIIDVTKGA